MTTKLKFPTHLRKMWSGSEVQEWLDKQEQEPVAIVEVNQMGIPEITWDKFDEYAAGRYELYAAPVRTKNLTDYEIGELILENKMLGLQSLARAVIAADRKLNGVEK